MRAILWIVVAFFTIVTATPVSAQVPILDPDLGARSANVFGHFEYKITPCFPSIPFRCLKAEGRRDIFNRCQKAGDFYLKQGQMDLAQEVFAALCRRGTSSGCLSWARVRFGPETSGDDLSEALDTHCVAGEPLACAAQGATLAEAGKHAEAGHAYLQACMTGENLLVPYCSKASFTLSKFSGLGASIEAMMEACEAHPRQCGSLSPALNYDPGHLLATYGRGSTKNLTATEIRRRFGQQCDEKTPVGCDLAGLAADSLHDDKAAKAYFSRGCEHGLAHACYRFGRILCSKYLRGKYDPSEPSFQPFLQACDGGVMVACHEYGEAVGSRKYLDKACRGGFPGSCWSMAGHGRDVPADEYLKLGCEFEPENEACTQPPLELNFEREERIRNYDPMCFREGSRSACEAYADLMSDEGAADEAVEALRIPCEEGVPWACSEAARLADQGGRTADAQPLYARAVDACWRRCGTGDGPDGYEDDSIINCQVCGGLLAKAGSGPAYDAWVVRCEEGDERACLVLSGARMSLLTYSQLPTAFVVIGLLLGWMVFSGLRRWRTSTVETEGSL